MQPVFQPAGAADIPHVFQGRTGVAERHRGPPSRFRLGQALGPELLRLHLDMEPKFLGPLGVEPPSPEQPPDPVRQLCKESHEMSPAQLRIQFTARDDRSQLARSSASRRRPAGVRE